MGGGGWRLCRRVIHDGSFENGSKVPLHKTLNAISIRSMIETVQENSVYHEEMMRISNEQSANFDGHVQYYFNLQ
jgi:hypothetical protein